MTGVVKADIWSFGIVLIEIFTYGKEPYEGTVQRVDPSWGTHWAMSHSSQCSTTGVTKAVVCYDWCCKGRHLVIRHRPRRDLHLRQGALQRYGAAGRSLVGDPLSYVSRSSQCSTTGVTKAVVCYDWCCKGRHLVVRHRPHRDLHLRQGALRRYGSAGRSLMVDPLSYVSRSSQCSTTGVTKAVVCYDWCSKGRYLVVRHRPRRDLHLRQGALWRYGAAGRSLMVDPRSYLSRSIGSIPRGVHPLSYLCHSIQCSTTGSSVVRAFAHGAMGRRIDPSWGGLTEILLSFQTVLHH